VTVKDLETNLLEDYLFICDSFEVELTEMIPKEQQDSNPIIKKE
jgi:hypothetical protein